MLRAGEQLDSGKPQHVSRDRGTPELEELDDGEVDDSDDPDLFSSPVGGGGFIGKWLKKMLSSARKQELRFEAVDLSVTIASKLLQRNVSKQDNERLIEETFKQLEAQHPGYIV